MVRALIIAGANKEAKDKVGGPYPLATRFWCQAKQRVILGRQAPVVWGFLRDEVGLPNALPVRAC